MTDWKAIADELAAVLLRNGVGGKAFNEAMNRYHQAVAIEGGKA